MIKDHYTAEEKLKIFTEEYLPSLINRIYEDVVYGTEEELRHKYFHEFGIMFINVQRSMYNTRISFDEYLCLRGVSLRQDLFEDKIKSAKKTLSRLTKLPHNNKDEKIF